MSYNLTRIFDRESFTPACQPEILQALCCRPAESIQSSVRGSTTAHYFPTSIHCSGRGYREVGIQSTNFSQTGLFGPDKPHDQTGIEGLNQNLTSVIDLDRPGVNSTRITEILNAIFPTPTERMRKSAGDLALPHDYSGIIDIRGPTLSNTQRTELDPFNRRSKSRLGFRTQIIRFLQKVVQILGLSHLTAGPG